MHQFSFKHINKGAISGTITTGSQSRIPMRKLLFLIPLFLFHLPLHGAPSLIEQFGSLPAETHVKLSPGAKRIASIVSSSGARFLVIREVGKEGINPIFKVDNRNYTVRWLQWLSDERLLISILAPSSRYGIDTMESRLTAVNYDGSNSLNVVKLRSNELVPQFQDQVVDFLPDDPEHILLSLDKSTPLKPAVYKINVNNARSKTVHKSAKNVIRWMADRQHKIRLRVELDDGVFSIRTREVGAKKWQLFHSFDAFATDQIEPLGFGKNPNELYFRAYKGEYLAVFRTDITKPEQAWELMLSQPGADITGQLWYSNKFDEVVGVIDPNSDNYEIWNTEFLAFQKGLDQALSDTKNYILSMSADERKYILLATSSTLPGTLMFGDRDQGTLQPFTRQYPKIDEADLVKKQPFIYPARDGVPIQGYISAPTDQLGQRPVIVLPHGGPISRTGNGFDYWVQFLVKLGYTVVEMNFRGSAGYGHSHMTTGLGNWGTQIHNDITDATRWVIEKGIAAKDQICIVGGSFGGYAALMGVALEPDLYQCAIAFAPVTDLNRLLNESRRYSNAELNEIQIGTNKKILRETSPQRLVENIQTPVLLMHGELDRVVDVKHSRLMARAMEKAEKAVTYIEFEDGNHNLLIEDHRQEVLRQMQIFLAQELGG